METKHLETKKKHFLETKKPHLCFVKFQIWLRLDTRCRETDGRLDSRVMSLRRVCVYTFVAVLLSPSEVMDFSSIFSLFASSSGGFSLLCLLSGVPSLEGGGGEIFF